jgi:hypothetical protein
MANNPNFPHQGNVGGTSSRFGTDIGRTGHGVSESMKDTASSVVEKSKDIASSVSEKAQDTLSSLGARASDVASNVGRRASDAWETSRDYITNEGFSGMLDDVSDVIRRNPIPALCIGFGLGFILARAFKD